jgi:DNA polymerase III delta prime subunit
MLKESLLSKFKTKELSHFYILSCPLSQDEARTYLDEWSQDFLSDILCQKREGLSKEKALDSLKLGHADIQFIETKNKSYTVTGGEFDEFFKFLQHSANELDHKFIFVKDTHKITETLSNKLLKTLEEPPVDITIFFLDPIKKEILPTIASRAIMLNLPIENNIEDRSFDAKLSFEAWVNTVPNLEMNKAAQAIMAIESGNSQIHGLVEEIRAKSIEEEELLKLLMQWLTHTSQSGDKLELVISQSKTIDEQKVYHGPAQNRLIPLFTKLFTL